MGPSFNVKFQFKAFPQHNHLAHECLFHSLVLGRVREYFQAAHALTPLFHAPTSSNTTLIYFALHFQSDDFFTFL
jgi:hypothetical protein